MLSMSMQPVGLRVEVGPALEVADHHLRLELPHEVEVGGDVLREPGQRAGHVLEGGEALLHLVVLVDHREPPDAVHALELLLEELVGPVGDHHLDVVLPGEAVEEHLRPDGVAHALADDAVENPHAVTSEWNRRRS
jgi:hypothetical protein